VALLPLRLLGLAPVGGMTPGPERIAFEVLGTPIGQPRTTSRPVFRRGGAMVMKGGRPVLVKFVPGGHPIHNYREKIAWAARREIGHEGLGRAILFEEGPVAIRIVAIFDRPKSMIWKRRAMPRVWKTTKPDGDNIEKGVFDALKGIAWRDDSQIALQHVERFIGSWGETARTIVEIRRPGGVSAGRTASEHFLFENDSAPPKVSSPSGDSL
jgi:Holliday junction resolvase RusA-like endonuclease